MRKPPRPCPRPYCGGKIRNGSCDVCSYVKPVWSGTGKDDRPTTAERGYDAAWRRLKDRYLLDHPVCEDCDEAGLLTLAEEVHHVKPFKGKKDPLRLDPTNLRSLCSSCHAKHSQRQSRKPA